MMIFSAAQQGGFNVRVPFRVASFWNVEDTVCLKCGYMSSYRDVGYTVREGKKMWSLTLSRSRSVVKKRPKSRPVVQSRRVVVFFFVAGLFFQDREFDDVAQWPLSPQNDKKKHMSCHYCPPAGEWRGAAAKQRAGKRFFFGSDVKFLGCDLCFFNFFF